MSQARGVDAEDLPYSLGLAGVDPAALGAALAEGSDAQRVDGSWWEDWVAWASERSGTRVAPPALPEGEPAPGRYVRG